jgi:hypothetical protein
VAKGIIYRHTYNKQGRTDKKEVDEVIQPLVKPAGFFTQHNSVNLPPKFLLPDEAH